MKPVSTRSTTQRSSGSEFLETRFGDKVLGVTVTMKPDRLVAEQMMPEGDEVQVAVLQNPFGVTRQLTNLLSGAKSGDSLVIVCAGDKIYRAALKFLGLA
ncbi:hypothetical protein E0E54_07885 [Azotobacter chroococcum]|uniref:Uncharacterized protein n=2 Tax=Azotobacter chroococcum TaxID=353 RepID=A0A0C4WQC6_9GAMM|nr:hypothetical protein [Azotobacter chroococcum]AJE21750.1 Hypothetical protein Achr_23120 [Azotobacter chroococcum NCIMB 8003]QQE90407.1 hypothetical protein GKQ51_09080 [Azotobacter chroococcum]TBW02570.1 hypothetical protein E0E52_16145 [Azotobacter chroococcum]TBW37076.1 hypothetical protein E0E54_07885 [Azotobacter chroococcum]TKD46220.1 hypothetical protein FCG41_02445 [Azotobacter chroococcum]